MRRAPIIELFGKIDGDRFFFLFLFLLSAEFPATDKNNLLRDMTQNAQFE